MKHPAVIYFFATLLLSFTVSINVFLDDSAMKVTVRENEYVEVFIIEYPSNRYTWVLQDDKDANYVLEEHYQIIKPQVPGLPGRFAQPPKHVFKLKAVKKGKSYATFKRIEGEDYSEKTLVLTVQ